MVRLDAPYKTAALKGYDHRPGTLPVHACCMPIQFGAVSFDTPSEVVSGVE